MLRSLSAVLQRGLEPILQNCLELSSAIETFSECIIRAASLRLLGEVQCGLHSLKAKPSWGESGTPIASNVLSGDCTKTFPLNSHMSSPTGQSFECALISKG